MNKQIRLCFSIVFICFFTGASAITLNVGVSEFYPPFVMQTANNQLYGFDISLVQRMCKSLKVTCRYKPMPFEKLLPSVLLETVDMAISSLTITAERREMIHFSVPYMLSEGRFLVRQNNKIRPFTNTYLNHKTIGVQLGTIFTEYLESLHLKDYKVTYFKTESGQVKALMEKEVDIIILDNPAAIWWSLNTSNKTSIVGQPFKVGEGIGIAVAAKNKKYIKNINQAILHWQKDGSFHKSYNMYFHPRHRH